MFAYQAEAGNDQKPLTEREGEVLRLVAQGFSNRQIADTLVISEKTVQNHLSSSYRKLGVTSRLQAVRQANMLVYVSQTAVPLISSRAE